MSTETEIKTLKTMLLGMQLSLVHVLDQIAKTDRGLSEAIKKGFDGALDDAEVLSMREAGSERGQESSSMMQVIEGLRDLTFAGRKE